MVPPWLLDRLHVHHELQHDGIHQDPVAQRAQRPHLALAFTSVTILLLALLDNLKLPPADTFDALVDMGFRPQFLVLVSPCTSSQPGCKLELDAGSIYAWLGQGGEGEMTYNTKTNTWEVKSVDLVDNERAF